MDSWHCRPHAYAGHDGEDGPGAPMCLVFALRLLTGDWDADLSGRYGDVACDLAWSQRQGCCCSSLGPSDVQDEGVEV